MRELPHRIRRRLPVLAYLALVLALVVVLEFGTPGSGRKICKASQENRAVLRGLIERGKDVGKPGTPGYAYYTKHPEEKQAALDRVDKELDRLPPINCSGGLW